MTMCRRVQPPPNAPPKLSNKTPSNFDTTYQVTQTTVTMSGSSPPEDGKKADAEARTMEQAEQAALPYKWDQTIKDLDITISIEAKYKGKDLDVKIGRNTLKAGIKGQEPFIDVCDCKYEQSSTTNKHGSQGELPQAIRVDDSTWTLTPTSAGKDLEIHLDKQNQLEWWPHVITSAPKIDTSKIQPENSKLGDLDGETRGMVEKMMFDQRQKEAGKPTSDEQKKLDIFENFKKQHPEMDFSNVKMG